MNEIHEHLDAAIDEQRVHQQSLNQTMRECLAKPKNPSLMSNLNCRKGAAVISRELEYNMVDQTSRLYKGFIKAPTKISIDPDMCMSDIVSLKKSTEWKLWVNLAKRMGLINNNDKLTDKSNGISGKTTQVSQDKDAIVNVTDVNVEIEDGSLQSINAPKSEFNDLDINLPVIFPLEEVHGKTKFTRAKFTMKNFKELKITDVQGKVHVMMIGGDQENNSIFLRWTTSPVQIPGGTSERTETKIKECVLVFNRSHQLSILPISTPLFFGKKEAKVQKSDLIFGNLTGDIILSTVLTGDSDKFDGKKHDPTLYFLRKQFPATIFVDSKGGDTGLVNENDILSSESHVRNSVWNTVYLHWVFEGLCAVALSMGVDAKEIKKAGSTVVIDISAMDHDTMLVAIARAANIVTNRFKNMHPGENRGIDYVLSNLSSRHNSFIPGLDIDKKEYFGYRLTLWLLDDAEKNTILIPKYDANAPQRKILRGKLRSVDCDVSRTAIKTTYITDVLLEMVRKAYINPWELVYPFNDVNKLPNQLKEYSLKGNSSFPLWAIKDTMNDKQVSVVLKSTHMVRFAFHAFRRTFHGSNPVVASKQMEQAASKVKRMTRKRRMNENRQLRKAFTLRPVTVKRWLRNANSNTGDGSNALFPSRGIRKH